MKQNMGRNGPERIGKPLACAPARGISRSGGAPNMVRRAVLSADEQAGIGYARLILSLSPGDVAARARLVAIKVALLRRVGVADAGYAHVAEIDQLLADDQVAQLSRLGDVPQLGPGSRQDPVTGWYRTGRIGEAEWRAAREVQQVAEWLSVGGVGGVKAMDPMAVRVDGGGAMRMDIATYRAGHHAAGRVGDLMAAMRADSRRFDGRAGRAWSVADVFRAVVVDRRAVSFVVESIVVNQRTVVALVVDWLRTYARDAADIWAVMDAVETRDC
jgi:hypothetical protein